MERKREGTYTLMELPNGFRVMMSETELASYRKWLHKQREKEVEQTNSHEESGKQQQHIL